MFTFRCKQSDFVDIVCHRCRRYRWQIVPVLLIPSFLFLVFLPFFWCRFCCWHPLYDWRGVPSVLAPIVLLAFYWIMLLLTSEFWSWCFHVVVVFSAVASLLFMACILLLAFLLLLGFSIHSAPGVTSVVDVPSVAGVHAVASVLSVFSIHAVVWHSAVATTVANLPPSSFIPVANLLPVPYLRHRWQICHLCTGGALWLSNITANFRKNLKWS